ncbi:MAG: hypothetical protein HQL77_08715 [Magnetococcales bacterium]|nr:hypothetical protein [Magnetococcales bacterium]
MQNKKGAADHDCQPGIDFSAVIGLDGREGFLNQTQRESRLIRRENPYRFGRPLPANAPVFVDRKHSVPRIVRALNRADGPASVSILAERRMGKSSQINQVVHALAAIPGMVVAVSNPLGWSVKDPQTFFAALARAIHGVLPDVIELPGERMDFPAFRNTVRHLKEGGVRLVVVIDEFELLADTPTLNAVFFSNLRALVDEGYPIGYLTASRTPLKDLCRQRRIDGSNFWGIFNSTVTLGGLSVSEQTLLTEKIMKKSLPRKCMAQLEPKLLTWADGHPGLVQMVLEACWDAFVSGDAVDRDGLRSNLVPHVEEMWFNRNREEWEVLNLLVCDQTRPGDESTLLDLRLRGVLNEGNRLFSPILQEIIERQDPAGKDLSHVATAIMDGAVEAHTHFNRFQKTAEKWFKTGEQVAKKLGRIRKAFDQGRAEVDPADGQPTVDEEE